MLIFRLREKIKHEHVEDCLRQLLLNEKLTKEELLAWQISHLKDLLVYLSEHNPYYARCIKEQHIEINANYSTTGEMLSGFPVIDKSVIREHWNEWLTDELKYEQISLKSTSGSTGIPFRFYSSQIADDYKTASKYRLYHRFGINIDDKQLCFGASFNQGTSRFQKIKADLNNRFVNKRYFCDTSHFTKETILEVIRSINNLPIKSVWGYPSAIFEVAKYALDNDIKIDNKRLKAIFYSGESHDEYMNQVISQAFGKKVAIVDEFNSLEGFIAGTFKDGLLHLNDDTAIFEVLKPDGSISSHGKGELLVTSLFNKAFPFIRYKNGDVVEISESDGEIGVPFRILKSADGRSTSFIYNGNAKVPHTMCSHYLPHSNFKHQVKKFQIVQNEKESVLVKIVAYDEKSLDKQGLEQMYRELFDQINVRFEYLDDIPREKSGKFRDVIQNIK